MASGSQKATRPVCDKRECTAILRSRRPHARRETSCASKNAENAKAVRAKFREKLVLPPDAQAAGRLAARYTSPELGELIVKKQDSKVLFDLGEWKSSVVTRKNEDGTISFLTVDPGAGGFEFVESKKNDKRALIVREGQHEYVFTEI